MYKICIYLLNRFKMIWIAVLIYKKSDLIHDYMKPERIVILVYVSPSISSSVAFLRNQITTYRGIGVLKTSFYV